MLVSFLGYVIFIATCMYATTLGADDGDSGGASVNEPIKIFARLLSCNFQNKRYCFIHNGEKSHDEILIEINRNRSNSGPSVPSSTRTVIVYEINSLYRYIR